MRNNFIKEGEFPSELKLAGVVPLLKAGDSSEITINIPMSILSSSLKSSKESCIII